MIPEAPVTYHLVQYHHFPSYFFDGRPTWPTSPSKGDKVLDYALSPHSYRVGAICMNCKWKGQVRLPQGQGVTRAPGYRCPECRCDTVEGTQLVATDSPERDSSTELKRAKEHYAIKYAEYERKLAEWESKQKDSK